MKKIILLFLLAAVAAVAQPELKTQSWANNDNAFMDFANVLEANTYRNLAAREMAKLSSPNHDANSLRFLVDGDAGNLIEDMPLVLDEGYAAEPLSYVEVGHVQKSHDEPVLSIPPR